MQAKPAIHTGLAKAKLTKLILTLNALVFVISKGLITLRYYVNKFKKKILNKKELKYTPGLLFPRVTECYKYFVIH